MKNLKLKKSVTTGQHRNYTSQSIILKKVRLKKKEIFQRK